ncbi:MAG: YceI family protein [Fimbriimonas sp.]
MKTKIAFAALAIPAAFAGYVAFHPGVAAAQSPLAELQPTEFRQSGSYSLDAFHSSIGFEIGHMGLAHVHGRFNKKSGKLQVDTADPTKSSIEVTIATESVDTAVTPRDNHLRTGDFFEVAKYPEIKFKSTKIRKVEKGYVMDGDLTIKGVSKNVSIPFQVFGPLTDDKGGSRLGVIAEPITIKRLDYGVGSDQKLPNGASAISDEVSIRLSLEATLSK